MSAKLRRDCPALEDYIHAFDSSSGEWREGYVTDILSSQFIIRETFDGLPLFFKHGSSWSATRPATYKEPET